MANARSGGPRRPDLDYYEYKKLHEQRMREAAPANFRPAPVKPEAEKPVAPAPERKPVEVVREPERKIARAPEADPFEALDLQDADELDLPAEPLDLPEENKSLFSGMKALMKGVASRVPADEPEAQTANDSPRFDDGDEDADEDDVEPDDAPQIDNPIGDAFNKVKGLFQSARLKMAERRAAKSSETEEADDDEDQAPAKPAQTQDVADDAPVLSRRMRKAAEAMKPDEPPILDIGEVDEREVDELVSGPGTTVHTGFEQDEAPKAAEPLVEIEPDDEDDDDDLPSARGTRIFGFLKKFRGKSAQSDWDAQPDADEPDGEEQEMDEQQKAVLTQRLSEELASAPTLSRKERKALAAGKAVRTQAPAAPAIPAGNTVFAAAPSDEPATMPFTAPTSARTAYEVDEPTQQFKPLRVRPARTAAPEPVRPVEFDDEYDEDEDDDLPVRKAAKPAKPPKPPKEKKRRVYQDEDLEDEEYEEEGRYDDDYDDDYDDEYDDYDEDDERYEDEYHVSGGRRFLGFLKGLLIFILFLAVCVLALRQLEASRLISLGALRDAAGQVVPINLILPSPQPTATPMPTEAPTAEPTVAPTPQPEATAAAMETPSADIMQVEPTEFTSVD